MQLIKGEHPTDVNHLNEHTRNKKTHSLLVYLHKLSTSKILFLFNPRCPYIAGDIGCFPIFDAQTMNHAAKLKLSSNSFLLNRLIPDRPNGFQTNILESPKFKERVERL